MVSIPDPLGGIRPIRFRLCFDNVTTTVTHAKDFSRPTQILACAGGARWDKNQLVWGMVG